MSLHSHRMFNSCGAEWGGRDSHARNIHTHGWWCGRKSLKSDRQTDRMSDVTLEPRRSNSTTASQTNLYYLESDSDCIIL